MAIVTFPDTGDLISEQAWQRLNRAVAGKDWIGQRAAPESDLALSPSGRTLTIPPYVALIDGVLIDQDANSTVQVTGSGGFVYLNQDGTPSFSTSARTDRGTLLAAPVVTGASITAVNLRLHAARYPASLISVAEGGTLQAAIAARLPLAGGTMTGALVLAGAPTADAHAATKAYVDTLAAASLKPAAPLSLTLDGSTLAIGVTWNQPTTGGVINQYRIRWRTGSGSWSEDTVAYTVGSYNITGLAQGATYTVQVRGENAAGNGPYAQASAQTATRPSQIITLGSATASSTRRLEWFLNPSPQIDAALLPDNNTAFFRQIICDRGILTFNVGQSASFSSSRRDLSAAWEAANDAIVIRAGTLVFTIPGPANSTNRQTDAGEPYGWTLSLEKVNELDTFITAYASLSQADKNGTTMTLQA